MRRDDVLSIVRFNVDANNVVLDTAALLDEEQFTREFSPSHGSIRQMLIHILGGDVFFPAVCRGETPDMAAIEALATLADIRARFEQSAAEQIAYVESLDDAALLETVTISFGEHDFVLPRWQVLMQQISHAHWHRGELSILLSELGFPLPTIDLMVHWIKASGQTWPFGD